MSLNEIICFLKTLVEGKFRIIIKGITIIIEEINLKITHPNILLCMYSSTYIFNVYIYDA